MHGACCYVVDDRAYLKAHHSAVQYIASHHNTVRRRKKTPHNQCKDLCPVSHRARDIASAAKMSNNHRINKSVANLCA